MVQEADWVKRHPLVWLGRRKFAVSVHTTFDIDLWRKMARWQENIAIAHIVAKIGRSPLLIYRLRRGEAESMSKDF